ncbi:MAG: RagB/SusD family nutrient uptake outer membrane protein, partial [Bacteroidales bacterium]|nr:RagB/SusD family nutrient uptake outer membrane protein [Bacteroidales bacterium]
RYVAEAKFLRAFYYHILWKFWGSVPYYAVNPDGKDVPYIVPQVSEDELYGKIAEDLDWCTSENRLPEAVTLTQVGRVNRFGAYMLRADVVMLKKDETRYSSVLSQLQEIIGSGIYALTPSFEDIWTDEGEWNCESIWEINYSDNPSNRDWDDIFAPGGTIYPTFVCPDSYKGTRFAREGYGFGPVSPALKAAYDAADKRRDATIMDFKTDALAGEKYNPRQGDTGMFNKKYMGRADGYSNYIGSNSPELNFRYNLRIYRYSEALLRAAELLVRTGGSQAQADGYLKQVRDRAGVSAKAATLDNLLDEYRLEFALEGHRFFDLVRFDKADEVLGAKGYSAAKRYLPIPQTEIDRSEGTLKQNNY